MAGAGALVRTLPDQRPPFRFEVFGFGGPSEPPTTRIFVRATHADRRCPDAGVVIEKVWPSPIGVSAVVFGAGREDPVGALLEDAERLLDQG